MSFLEKEIFEIVKMRPEEVGEKIQNSKVMKYLKTSYGYLLRLVSGEKAVEGLRVFLKEKKIESGVFFAIGAMEKVSLSFYDLPSKKYLAYEVNYPVEVVSLVGNIAWLKDEIVLHCHGVFSDRNGKTIGGHVVEGIVGPTLEVIVFVSGETIERVFDKRIGLNLLDI